MTGWQFGELTALSETLAGVSGRVTPAVIKAISDGGDQIRDLARDLAPKGATGRMSRSIESTLYRAGGGAEVFAEIGPTVYYGRFLEHGTAKMAPQPFLAPAADQRTDAIAESILNAAAKEVLG